jgi:FAD/FMN-containing dehydrogenase
MAKKEWMTLEHGDTGMKLLKKIKKGLDPGNIMNPGKLGLGEENE